MPVTLNVSMITHWVRLKLFHWMPAELWYKQFEAVGCLTLILRHDTEFPIWMWHSFAMNVTNVQKTNKKKRKERRIITMYTCLFVLFSLFLYSSAFFGFRWRFQHFFGLTYLSHISENMQKWENRVHNRKKETKHIFKVWNNTNKLRVLLNKG